MLLRRRRRAPRLLALMAAFAVQIWSVAPVSASVIYCIGDDGHSGFELVLAGSRGCADCCHDEKARRARPEEPVVEAAVEHEPLSECTDITIAPATAVPGKVAVPAVFSPAVAAAFTTSRSRVAAAVSRTDTTADRSSALLHLRRIVLLI